MDLLRFTLEEKLKKEGPLAYRMAPSSLEEFVGQQHLLGTDKPLRQAILQGRLQSLIFYGPPGTGKTSLAMLIANLTRSFWVSLNAVSTGVKDVRQIISTALERRTAFQQKTILFIDEIHRFNKVQQDVLLPAVEKGILILIGATTENPFFYLISPLLSRSLLFRFHPLQKDEIKILVKRALYDKKRGLGFLNLALPDDTLDLIAEASGGDARIAFNVLEMCAVHLQEKAKSNSQAVVSPALVQDVIQEKHQIYDSRGDSHYDTASAFIKSIRGSDPDAALYWLAKMIRGGEDPAFILRRLLISAAEDVGLADPQALVIVQAAAAAFHMVGMPEGRIILALAVVYLSCAPKSNASYMALEKALKEVEARPDKNVPAHLRDNSYPGAKQNGKNYLYPHSYPGHFVKQNYWPENLERLSFYQPSQEGEEKHIAERLASWRLRDVPKNSR